MKHLLVAMIMTGSLMACNNGGNNEAPVNATDTAGLAAFRQAQQQAYIDSLATVKADSIAAVKARREKAIAASSDRTERVTTNSSYPANGEKKGWSKATKGAVIGGAAGAAAGAVIHKKNRVAGGVVGAAAGAGVGYGIGKRKDNKDKRD